MAGFHTGAAGRICFNERPKTPVVNIALCRPWLAKDETVAADEPAPVKRAAWSTPVLHETWLSSSARRERERERDGAPKLAQILRTVCLVTRIRQMDAKSQRRTAGPVKARQIVFWLAKRDTTLSFAQMGRMLGGRDHTTALYAVERVQGVVDYLDLAVPDDVAAAAELLWQAAWPPLKAIKNKV